MHWELHFWPHSRKRREQPVQTRNNWTFFGSDPGGHSGAVLRSFVASCQRVGVDPYAWFKDVLSRIASHPITWLAELLPQNWKSAQA